MTDNTGAKRRHFLQLGGVAIASLPLAVMSGKAAAASNASMRTALKYQPTPNGDKACSKCSQFVPGKSPADLGGCRLLAGDTEIAPTGCCVAWSPKAA